MSDDMVLRFERDLRIREYFIAVAAVAVAAADAAVAAAVAAAARMRR